ncbi:putative methyltransferase-like [Colletotrichum spaethianum]|uniref:Methyltransferase-like n=1 Tax=Colletotrichum spaethianum TaxID=700344 RepID=A0AA37PI31_9PEZI|nr:putative methyltransferase-like [Colletotrichum spaethianum]GKT52627.1 putative methyltransferase-like [Colletotrichum spaethianum]
MTGTAGCFKDVQGVIREAYKHLEPGGTLQVADFDLSPQRADGTCSHNDPVFQFFQRHTTAAAELKRPISIVPQYDEMMKAAGFNVLKHEVIKVPTNPWQRDEMGQKIGRFMEEVITGDPEGMFKDRMVRGLGEVPEQVDLDCVTIRSHLKDRQNRIYFPL